MVKLVYLGASGTDERLDNTFSTAGGTFSVSGKTSATWVDSETGSQITFEGSKLTFKSGELVSGHIDKVLFEDVEDADIAKFTGEFETKKLGAALANGDVLGFVERALHGNDEIIGSQRDDAISGDKGKDTIRSGAGKDIIRADVGNDIIYGGAGSDTFLFFVKGQNNPHDGHDTIMDFDANGGGKKQDYIGAEWDDVASVHRSGHDTVIDFDGGGSIRLIGVDKQDIDHHDFVTLI